MNLASIFTLAGVLILFHVNKINASSRYTCFPLSQHKFNDTKKLSVNVQCESTELFDCTYSLVKNEGEEIVFQHFFIYKDNQYLSLFQNKTEEFIFDQKEMTLAKSHANPKNTDTKSYYNCQIN